MSTTTEDKILTDAERTRIYDAACKYIAGSPALAPDPPYTPVPGGTFEFAMLCVDLRAQLAEANERYLKQANIANNDMLAADLRIASLQVTTEKLQGELAEAKERADKAETLIYVPGLWQCAKCKLPIICSTMNVNNGTLVANNMPQTCPNGCGPMWRVTERSRRKEVMADFDKCFDEKKAAEATTERLAAHVAYLENWIDGNGMRVPKPTQALMKHYGLMKIDAPQGTTPQTQYENVSCSQCGASFGPGDHGFSHCDQHQAPEVWIPQLIRDHFDKAPDLGSAGYKAFDDSWDDGADDIARKIIERFKATSTAKA